jgi:hypothetical protein
MVVAFDGEADGIDQAVRVEEAAVAVGGLPARGGPGVEVAELDAEHGRLKRVDPRVESDFVVVIFRLHAVDPEPGHLPCQSLVVGGDHPGIAEAAEVLRRVEAEGGGVAEAPRRRPL